MLLHEVPALETRGLSGWLAAPSEGGTGCGRGRFGPGAGAGRADPDGELATAPRALARAQAPRAPAHRPSPGRAGRCLSAFVPRAAGSSAAGGRDPELGRSAQAGAAQLTLAGEAPGQSQRLAQASAEPQPPAPPRPGDRMRGPRPGSGSPCAPRRAVPRRGARCPRSARAPPVSVTPRTPPLEATAALSARHLRPAAASCSLGARADSPVARKEAVTARPVPLVPGPGSQCVAGLGGRSADIYGMDEGSQSGGAGAPEWVRTTRLSLWHTAQVTSPPKARPLRKGCAPGPRREQSPRCRVGTRIPPTRLCAVHAGGSA